MSSTMRFWVLTAAAGATSAALCYAGGIGALGIGAGGLMFLAYLAHLPLFLVGLAFGASGGAVASTAGAAAILFATGPVAALAYGALFALPVLVLVRQALLSRPAAEGSADANLPSPAEAGFAKAGPSARNSTQPPGFAGGAVEWYPAGLVAGWWVALGMVALAVVLLAFTLFGGGFEPAARAWTGQSIALVMPQVTALQRDRAVEFLWPVIPAAVAGSWMVMIAVNAALAQGVLAGFGWNRRPSPDLAAFELPVWVVVALALALAGAVLLPGEAGLMAMSFLPVAALGLALAGLGVVHGATRRWPQVRTAILFAVYGACFLLGWPVVVLMMLGLAEPWLKLRGGAGGAHT